MASKKLVMLVDDSFIDNFVNQKIIKRNKFAEKIITFRKSEEALKYLSDEGEKSNTSNIPDILFLDSNMPLINGFQFLEMYDQLPELIKLNCRIVVLTNSVDPIDIAQFNSNRNVMKLLNKPLLKDHLIDMELLLKQSLLPFLKLSQNKGPTVVLK